MSLSFMKDFISMLRHKHFELLCHLNTKRDIKNQCMNLNNEWMINEWMNEWINEWCIYIALYCVFLYTQSALQSCWGGGGGGCHVGWCDGCQMTTAPVRSPHTSYRWRGERVIETIKCMRSPHTSYRWRGERHRANQVYALTTHQLQVERRET